MNAFRSRSIHFCYSIFIWNVQFDACKQHFIHFWLIVWMPMFRIVSIKKNEIHCNAFAVNCSAISLKSNNVHGAHTRIDTRITLNDSSRIKYVDIKSILIAFYNEWFDTIFSENNDLRLFEHKWIVDGSECNHRYKVEFVHKLVDIVKWNLVSHSFTCAYNKGSLSP